LEWIDEVIGIEHQNFFEGKATSYMKAGLRGEHGSLTFTDIRNEEE
jgi:ribonucleotide reductase beta subunit family protein with ferritin-like domain